MTTTTPTRDPVARVHHRGRIAVTVALTAAGIVAEEPARGLLFSDSALMLQAAISGQGLGLARQTIAADAIHAGLLLRPFTALAESPHLYYFVCRKDTLESAAVAKFRQWVFRQAEEFPAPE